VTLKEAIKTLSPTIRKLLRRGYSRTMVVDLLREQGVNVRLSTLKQYFREKATQGDDHGIESPSTSAAEAAPHLASAKSGGAAALASSTSVAGLRRTPAA